MMRFIVVSACFVALLLCLPTDGLAENTNAPFGQYCVMPVPDCGFYWGFTTSMFDPIRANPQLARRELLHSLRLQDRTKGIAWARSMLDLADAYQALDSLETKKRCAGQALIELDRLWGVTPTAECAFLLGEAYGKFKNEKTAQPWYERSLVTDPDYYPAVFALTRDADDEGLAVYEEWLKRSFQLSERLLASDLPAPVRADVAFQYADLLTGVQITGAIRSMFGFLESTIEHPDPDSTAFERQLLEQFISTFGMMTHPKCIELYRMAARLNPRVTGYRLAQAASEVGRMLLVSLEDAKNREMIEQESAGVDVIDALYGAHQEKLLLIREQLAAIPAAELERYPSAWYFRGLVSFTLGDYASAQQELRTYLTYQPMDQNAAGLLCGTVVTMATGVELATDAAFVDFCALDRRMCDQHPTASGCYRVGYFQWSNGDIPGALALFQKATMLDPAKHAPRIATAVIAYQNGDVVTARSIVEVIKAGSTLPSGSDATCFHLLEAVLSAQRGNIDEAKRLARLAKEGDSELSEPRQLLDELERHSTQPNLQRR
ncbi:MAG: hypothetical protein PHI73_04215 [Patescibacteria group bacterium]|nr:hypothetical protein [Patescibacteria group bacterium]